MQVLGLYGGREITTYATQGIVNKRAERTRYVDESMLMTGDIITYQSGSNYETFTWLYIKSDAGGKLIRFGSDGVVELTGDSLEQLLTNLIGKKRFVVLRPALAFDL
jgi:hypothetical protein